jgi:branched-chain amino acid transport system permease protein
MIRPTGIINFAVGEWAMVAAFGGYVLLTKYELPYPLGMGIVLAFMLLVGWITERIAVRPLVEKGSSLLAPILALLGVLVITREIISVSFPPDPLPVPFPFELQHQKYFIIAVTLAVFVAAWLFFEKTLWGRSFEAVALNRRAAALMGINLSRVTAFSFAGGAAVAGLGGLLVSPNVSAHYLMGVPLAIQGFTALVIGGVGRVEGALLGGLLLAFAEQFTVRYAPIPGGFAQGVPLLFLMIFLVVRPTGLLRARA